jgi:mono/diheme cytochrome c family protein
MVLAVLGLSWLRYQSPWTPHAAAELPATPAGIVLAAEAGQGRHLFKQYGCTTCHSIAGSGGAKVGSDLARLETLYSPSELRQYILQPPKGVAMPSYAGRIDDGELEQIVAYVLVAQTFRRVQE